MNMTEEKSETNDSHHEHTEEKTESNPTEVKKESDTITISKDKLWKYSTFLLAIVLVGVVVGFLVTGDGGSTTGAVIDDGNNLPPPSANIEVTADDNFLFGSPSAKVKIVEYSDFECPFCARLNSEAAAQIKAEYADNPDVAFIYRHLPLDINCNSGMSRQLHPNACKAAEASECAADQGKFVEMHDMLFESGVAGEGVATFKQYASDLGLDTTAFNSCLDSGEKDSDIQQDLASARSVGASGTPASFVNGISVSGAQPFNVFDQLIRAELQK